MTGTLVRIVALSAIAAALLPAVAAAQDPVVAPAAAPPAPGIIAAGVSIAAVPVAGLPEADAVRAVIAQHVAPRRAPLAVTFRGRTLSINPVAAGYTADVAYAAKVAMLYGRTKALPPAGVVTVPLREKVNRARLAAILAARARANDLSARDARLTFSGVKPVVTKPRIGITIDLRKAAKTVESAILLRDKARYALPSERVRPAVTNVGPAIIIERSRYRLTLWRAGTVKTFPIAVGQSAYPTPAGIFRIITKQTNPTWFPPDSPWAAGLGPVPPGVNNPLGTRWMGTSAPAIGIHGTPQASSIGSAVSHGCIRMYIRDAEYLYDQIDIGTPVVIR